MIPKGSWVEIFQEVLSKEERASNIPEDTKATSIGLWAKGCLLDGSEIGALASIRTVNGRILEGIITEVNPGYSHDFGDFMPEIMFIGIQVKKILWGDEVE